MIPVEKIIKTFYSARDVEAEIKCMELYLDAHLKLLSKAMKEGNEEEIAFQKEKLKKVWNKLNELEYFSWKAE